MKRISCLVSASVASLIIGLTTSCVGPGVGRFVQGEPDATSAGESSTLRRPSKAPYPKTLYVSTVGNDTWSGSLAEPNKEGTDGPYATITRARDKIRDLKKVSKSLAEPITVYIRDGVYELNGTLEFTNEDSGTQTAPITYTAFPGENPILSGGQRITGWRPTISPLGDEGEVWEADAPSHSTGESDISQLFVNGQRRKRARTPNTGWFKTSGPAPLPGSRFHYRSEDFDPAWATKSDVEVVMLVRWRAWRVFINRVDASTNTVMLSAPLPADVQDWNARYCLENLLQGFDEPGEWYFDHDSGKIFYRPLPGEVIESTEITAERITTILNIQGGGQGAPVHNLVFKHLRFRFGGYSIPALGYVDLFCSNDVTEAIRVADAAFCTIQNCEISKVGGHALRLEGSVHDIEIRGNRIYDIGGGGIIAVQRIDNVGKLGSPDRITIEDNELSDLGLIHYSAPAIRLFKAHNSSVSHNHIHHTYYSGIVVGGSWDNSEQKSFSNVISKNKIHHVGQGLMSDLGCIFVHQPQPDTLIDNNVCHDIDSFDSGAWGIYLDVGAQWITVQNNVVYRTRDGGFLQTIGSNNVVRNNIFAFGTNKQLFRNHEDLLPSFAFEHNIVIWKDGPLLYGFWANNQFLFDNNVYFKIGGGQFDFSGWSFAEWQNRGQDLHSIVGDPLFADPENGDFTLSPASPALALGFQPIDVDDVGPRSE